MDHFDAKLLLKFSGANRLIGINSLWRYSQNYATYAFKCYVEDCTLIYDCTKHQETGAHFYEDLKVCTDM